MSFEVPTRRQASVFRGFDSVREMGFLFISGCFAASATTKKVFIVLSVELHD